MERGLKMMCKSARCNFGRAALTLAFVGCLLVMAIPAAAQGAGYWHTSGNQILDSNNQPVRIAGVNWYGFETTDELIHGLWAQDYHTIINELKSNGYNTIRMPFSNQMVETPINPTNFTQNVNGQAVNTDLVGLNALQIMDKIITAAGAAGLKVILDNHRSEAGNSNEANGLWYTSAFPDSNWVNDWVTLATRYKSFTDANGNPIVIGMDLRNEPHVLANGGRTGACWTGDASTNGCPVTNTAQNWPVAATKAGNAILAVNPKLLIFVEGNDCFNTDCGWQGGNLEGVASAPITLSVSNQLVYSAHDYGPNLFGQPWFNSSTTTASLQAVWNKFWNFVSTQGIAPVWVGEFGDDNNASDLQSTTPGSEGQWFSNLVSFLGSNPNLSWTYWAANGEDSFALLNSQYNGIVSSQKQSMLATIQFPLGGGGSKAPTISSISPASAAPGASITITGTNFSTTANANIVSFGSATATVTAATATSLTVTVPNIAAGGVNVTVSVNGVASNAVSFTVAGTNPDFSLSASPTSLTVVQGGCSSVTITVTAINGFTGTVTFAVSGLPAGITATINGTTVTFCASSTATKGTFNVTVTGTSGTLSHSVTIPLTVSGAPDFTLSASPATRSVAQGATGSSTITVAPVNGFSGTVALAASGLPAGVTASFSPASTTGSSTLTFTASSTATVGTANVTVTGTSGSLSHSTTIALTITTPVTGNGGVTLATVINSNSPWFDDEGVKLTNTGAITALSITINVQNTGGMSFNGEYNTVGGQITQSHSSTATVITYQFGLSAGQTLNPGSYLFDAQMSANGTAHPTSGDTFTVTYTTGGQTFTQTGHF
jgi:endoglucanase